MLSPEHGTGTRVNRGAARPFVGRFCHAVALVSTISSSANGITWAAYRTESACFMGSGDTIPESQVGPGTPDLISRGAAGAEPGQVKSSPSKTTMSFSESMSGRLDTVRTFCGWGPALAHLAPMAF
jgi:hypothetical protein